MPTINRLNVFYNGTRSDADQVNQEFDQLIELVNGGLDQYNIKPGGISKENIGYHLVEIDDEAVMPDATLSSAKIWEIMGTQEEYFFSQYKDVRDSLTQLGERKADKEDTHTKQQIIDLLNGKSDKLTTYTKTEADGLLGDKSDKLTTYTKEETNNLLQTKSNAANVYSKSQMIEFLADKQDAFIRSDTQPEMEVGKIWHDTSSNPNVFWYMSENGLVMIGGSGASGEAVINDLLVSASTTYSSQKLIEDFAPKNHTHDLSPVTDLIEQGLSVKENSFARYDLFPDVGIFELNDKVIIGDELYEVIEGDSGNKFHPISQNAEFVSISRYGGHPSLEDNSPAIQEALSKHEAVFIPAGVYKVKQSIKIPSNRHLKMATGTVIKRNDNIKSVFINQTDGTIGGWNANKNIIIEGGTIDGNYTQFAPGTSREFGLVVITHSTDITIRNVHFRNQDRWHMIEINSSYNVLVENCRFTDYLKTDANATEAIQIDYAGQTQLPMLEGQPWDAYHCQNIFIRGCIFQNVHHAVGSHSAIPGSLHRKISITNCQFFDLSGYVVTGINWEDVDIEHNLIERADNGIHLTLAGSNSSRIRIANNRLYTIGYRAGTYDNVARAINIQSNANNIFDRVEISGNFLSQIGKYGIGFDLSRNVVVERNFVQNVYAAGIWSYGGKKILITGNVVEGAGVAATLNTQSIKVGNTSVLGDKGVIVSNNRMETFYCENTDNVAFVNNILNPAGTKLLSNTNFVETGNVVF